jgi:hypothetical protein
MNVLLVAHVVGMNALLGRPPLQAKPTCSSGPTNAKHIPGLIHGQQGQHEESRREILRRHRMQVAWDDAVSESPALIPHGELQLPTSIASSKFSLLSWNCLLPNSEDNWWCEKMYQTCRKRLEGGHIGKS